MDKGRNSPGVELHLKEITFYLNSAQVHLQLSLYARFYGCGKKEKGSKIVQSYLYFCDIMPSGNQLTQVRLFPPSSI